MEPYTLLTVGFVMLAAAAFVAARVGAAAVGVLPAATGADDASDDARAGDAEPHAGAEADEGVSAIRDDTDEGRASRITPDDRERIRNHLEKDPHRRSPDDLLPSDADDGS